MKKRTGLAKSALMCLLCSLSMFLLIGCETKFQEKTCAYCGGGIYWSQMNSGGFSTQWRQEFENNNGKNYHKWCYKIAKDAGKLN